MSLLEDIFLQDEANEARELERVIEGDEYDERPRSLEGSDDESDNNGNREDEAEEDKRRVDPNSTKTKKVTKNPRFILNPARLTGPRGIQVIPEHFKDFKFKGKGHEKEDLDMVLKKLEHWAYRLYPKFQFEDCLKKIETLGKKRPVMVHLQKIRSDQFMSEETVVQKDSSDDEDQPPQEEDEFDKLLQQQIELARATPAPGSVKKVIDRSDQWNKLLETPSREDRSLTMPKATSSPSISDEQKERMIRNRKLAEERRLARLKNTSNTNSSPTTIIEMDENEATSNNKSTSEVVEIQDQIPTPNNINEIIEVNDEYTIASKRNRSNIIDSSDSENECNVTAVNESITVDVHNEKPIEKVKVYNKTKKVNHDFDGIEEMAVDEDENEKADNIVMAENKNCSKEVNNKVIHAIEQSNKAENEDDSNVRLSDKNMGKIGQNTAIVEENIVVNDHKVSTEVENQQNTNNSSINDDIEKEIDEKVQNSPKSHKDSNSEEKEVTNDAANAFTEEIMDVDFSEEF